ncbi:MAG: UvrD-helicase domain-containing protein, partial [Acidobacteriota bacterium]
MTTVPPDRETLEARDAEARRRIEHDLDVSLVVEAAAGAGKTTLLVGRLIALLAAGKATVDGIAAVTFTRKAAGELKLRLRQALDGARSAEADAVRRARLEDALAHLETARIGTIHGLCAELLRARPVEAGIDPHFREIDQDAARAHYDRLFDRWLQARLDDPPAGLRRALARLAARGGRAGGPGGNHDDPLAQLRHAGWELAEWRDFPAPWTAPAEDASRAAQIERLIDDVRALADLHDRCPDRHDALKQAFAPAALTAAWFAISARAGGAPDLDVAEGQLLALANDLRGHRFKRGRGRWFVPAVAAAARSGDAARDDGVTRDDAIAQRDALMEAIQAFRDDADAALAAALREDLRATVEAYDASKRRLGDLDFLDLLLCARDLLRDRDDVRRAFQQQIRHVFVDEFQDTDPLQAEILLLLAADDPAERDWRRVRPAPGKLFLVGDPKQSIYRFRRADLGLYRRVCAQLAAAGVPQLHLHRSFRALEPLQGTINAAFAPEMIADDDVQQPDYAAMLPHRRVPDDVAQPAIVALPAPYPYGYRDVTKTAIEGCLPDAVAAWIAWLLHESGWTVADPARGGARVPVRPRHVAVLFRRFVSWGDDVTRGYVRGLEARAVPYVLIGGRGFHQRAEVMTLRAALRAIESPDDALAVYAALRGDLFALGDDQLLAYSLAYGRPHPLRVPRALVDDHAARAHFAPVLDALAALARLHRRRNRVPAATVIDDLLAAVRAHAGFVLRPAGRQVLANVERVAELARRAERAEGASFGRFVASLEAAADRIGAGGDAPAMDALADGVRVMTVHSAKGLEFPIVVLADPTAKLAAARPGRAIDPEAGRAAVRLMGCAPEDLRRAEAIEQQRDRAEGVRLAYVAATRARDVLVVPVVG